MRMVVSEEPEKIDFLKFSNGDLFLSQATQLWREFGLRGSREAVIIDQQAPFSYPGHCGICQRDVEFSCDWLIHGTNPDGTKQPVWRERLVCPCGLSNRLRASFHFMLDQCGLKPDSSVYLTEQLTPFYGLVSDYCNDLTGSEYLRDGTASGEVNARGIRHEDITALSFKDASFDVVGSFEVLEHVPDYKAGLRELARIIKPGGHLVATFPFRMDLKETLTRARLTSEGSIEHLMEPEYHGDPLSKDGVLCFYHFGWDILDDLRLAGFKEASCNMVWSWESGYLGHGIQLFHAMR